MKQLPFSSFTPPAPVLGARLFAIVLLTLTCPVIRQGFARDAALPDPARIEGAITGGLRWLAGQQIREGSEAGAWPVEYANYRPAVTALAGMAFLANGHLPGDEGPYGETVAKALRYVIGTMDPSGYSGQGDRSGMYIHAITSLFALSCLGMQADESLEPDLAEWVRRSLTLILDSQQIAKAAAARGGWRYTPYTSESDVSVTCWQLLVLHSARQAGYPVPSSAFDSALAYIHRAFAPVEPLSEDDPPAGGYLYRPGISREPEPAVSALVLHIQTLFDAASESQTQATLNYLQRYPPTWGGPQYGGFFYFAGFYMVQGMFQTGGQAWNAFGPPMAKLLLDHQAGDGSWPFPPDNTAQSRLTGPAYPVAMAVLILSIEKQFLPMVQRQHKLYP